MVASAWRYRAPGCATAEVPHVRLHDLCHLAQGYAAAAAAPWGSVTSLATTSRTSGTGQAPPVRIPAVLRACPRSPRLSGRGQHTGERGRESFQLPVFQVLGEVLFDPGEIRRGRLSVAQ